MKCYAMIQPVDDGFVGLILTTAGEEVVEVKGRSPDWIWEVLARDGKQVVREKLGPAAQVVRVDSVEAHPQASRALDVWQRGRLPTDEPEDEPEVTPGELKALREEAHLCGRCTIEDLCTVGRAVRDLTEAASPIVSYCARFDPGGET